jgi:antitoxin ParD1/3/4
MPNVSLGPYFEAFIEKQIVEGRFQNASEVVRAGLRLLEDEVLHAGRLAELRRRIDDAFDDPRPSVPADEVFARIEHKHAERVKAGRHGA